MMYRFLAGSFSQPRSTPLSARTTAPAISITIDPGQFANAPAAPHLAGRRHDRHEHGSFLGRQSQPASACRLAPGEQMLRRDLVPTRDLRCHRSGRVGFRDELCPSRPNWMLPRHGKNRHQGESRLRKQWGEHTTRKPMSTSRLFGSFQLR